MGGKGQQTAPAPAAPAPASGTSTGTSAADNGSMYGVSLFGPEGAPQLQLDPSLLAMFGNQGMLDYLLTPGALQLGQKQPGPTPFPPFPAPQAGPQGAGAPKAPNLKVSPDSTIVGQQKPPFLDPSLGGGKRPLQLPMPFLDKVPFGGKLRDTVNDWLKDPTGKDKPQPRVVEPPSRGEDDPCRLSTTPDQCRKDTSPTILKTPSIPIPGT